MASPTRWLHGFIFRHDFEILRDSWYKSCSRDCFYHPCLGSRKTSDPKYAQLGSCHIWTPSWPVHDTNILLVLKGCRVTPCMGRAIVLYVHKVTSKHPRRPLETFDSSGSGCTDAASWLHPPRPAHSSPMVDCTPYHDHDFSPMICQINGALTFCVYHFNCFFKVN